MTVPFYSWKVLEEAVVELLQDFGITEYPINPLELASRMGIKVRFYSEYDNLSQQAFKTASSDAFLAINLATCQPSIFAKQDVTPSSRLGFSVCHEIAHWWLGHEKGTDREEDEANFFAGYLLAPHPLIIKHEMNQFQVQELFSMGDWAAEIAYKQAQRRRSYRRGLLEHEIWILNNLILKCDKKVPANTSISYLYGRM